MRLFVSVPIPSQAAVACQDVRRRLERRLPGVRWTDARQYHFTLKFLGDVLDDAAQRVRSVLGACLEKVRPFEVELAGLGTFPSGKSPRVIWIGVRAGARELTALAERLDHALADGAGLARSERPFQAHLTLGRFAAAQAPGATGRREPPELPDGAGDALGRFPVDQIFLMQSRLAPRGAIHSVVQEYPLREAG